MTRRNASGTVLLILGLMAVALGVAPSDACAQCGGCLFPDGYYSGCNENSPNPKGYGNGSYSDGLFDGAVIWLYRCKSGKDVYSEVICHQALDPWPYRYDVERVGGGGDDGSADEGSEAMSSCPLYDPWPYRYDVERVGGGRDDGSADEGAEAMFDLLYGP